MKQLEFEFYASKNTTVYATLDPEEYQGLTRAHIFEAVCETVSEMHPGYNIDTGSLVDAADVILQTLAEATDGNSEDSGG